MNFIENLWERLNLLTPNPQCITSSNNYDSIIWSDSRPIPSYQELLDVDIDTKDKAKDNINFAAGRARKRVEHALVSVGHGTLDEYRIAAESVRIWRLSGSPIDNIPEPVMSWAEPNSITPEQSALELESQESFLVSKVNEIRRIRLSGIVSVDEALGGYEAISSHYIDLLDQYDPLL